MPVYRTRILLEGLRDQFNRCCLKGVVCKLGQVHGIGDGFLQTIGVLATSHVRFDIVRR